MNFLKEEYGVTNDILHPEELEKFVDTIINKGLKQGFNSNDLLSLEAIKSLPAFDVISNKQVIESLINSGLKNDVIDSRRKGDMMAQASDVGFEKHIAINSRASAEASWKHNLKFYRYAWDANGKIRLDKNGKPEMLPMEIMVALPKHLIDYVVAKYGNGTTITQQAS